MEKSLLQTPRAFFIQEMQQSYARWQSALGRELVQNSADAGAKNIHVTMSLEKGVGAFGEEPEADEVIRIVFQDDGSGMTADILENVYFRIGESTKRDANDTIGGFGRARLLNFAMVKYWIVTQDRVVEGSGAEYVHRSFAEMAEFLEAKSAALRSESDSPITDELRLRIEELDRRADEMRSLAASGSFKGCRIEVDIDTKMYGPDSWRNPTLDEMMREFSGYLKTSQLPCKVFVNGEERKDKLQRGPARRTLEATLPDGNTVPFATVHTNKSAGSSDFSKTMLVRVGGATMFKTDIEADMRVIIELDPGMARDVLTSNRDGFRSPYSEAYEALKRELISDIRSALDDRENVHQTHAGGLGKMLAQKPVEDLAEFADVGPEIASSNPKFHEKPISRQSKAVSTLESQGFAGIPFPTLKWFFNQIENYKAGILDDFARDAMRDRVSSAIAGRYGVDRVRTALDTLEPEELEFVVGLLKARMAASDKKAKEEAAARLAGLPDVHVHVKGELNAQLRKAITRNDPRKWDPATGQGKAARNLLAAWTVCCDVAIRTLMKHHPDAAPADSFSWSPGFVYTAPKQEYVLGATRNAFMIDAEFVHDKKSDERFFLINPVDSEGHLKYRPAEREDLQKLVALAAHEAAHLSSHYHDENFAMLMTSLMSNMDLQEIRQRTNDALKDIREIYSKARVKVQAMDTETGPRPADRLMANLAPVATASAAIINSHAAEGRRFSVPDLLSAVTEPQSDGTVVYDMGPVIELEEALEADHAYDNGPEMSRSPSNNW